MLIVLPRFLHRLHKCRCNSSSTGYHSHLVEHTADIVPTAGFTSVGMVVVHLRSRTHGWSARTRRHALWWQARATWALWTWVLTWRTRCCFCCVSILNLCHTSNSPTAQPHVLVAVSPAVHGALNQAAFFAQIGVQLRKCPADRVAFALVV